MGGKGDILMQELHLDPGVRVINLASFILCFLNPVGNWGLGEMEICINSAE